MNLNNKKKAEISKKMLAVNDVSEEKITNLAFGLDANSEQEKQGGNIAFGTNALKECKTGESNIAFGANALQNVTSSSNIGFGTNAGLTLETGNNNIIIGRNADVGKKKKNGESAPAPNAMNQIVLGEGAKGHGDNKLTFGGDISDTKNTGENALKAIHPGSNDFTSLGNKTHAFKSLYVSDLYCTDDLSLTLPTEDGNGKYNFVKTNSDGVLSFADINRISGLIVESQGKTITLDSSNEVEITATDVVNGDGRLILGSSEVPTTSILFKSTAEEFINALNLKKDFDFIENSFIKIDGSSSLTLYTSGNINLRYISDESSDGNILFNLHEGSGTQTITNDFTTIFRITRLSEKSIEVFFKNA
mgnify:CR=1 FL=1